MKEKSSNKKYYQIIKIQNKDILILQDGKFIIKISYNLNFAEGENKETEIIQNTVNQLKEYLCGERKIFDVPIMPIGTKFQKTVWNCLKTVEYGKTMTYKQIAVAIGKPNACRAVGNANNKNPISIIIPCHRIIGTNGKLTGYAGGLDIKEFLLNIEKNVHKACQ